MVKVLVLGYHLFQDPKFNTYANNPLGAHSIMKNQQFNQFYLEKLTSTVHGTGLLGRSGSKEPYLGEAPQHQIKKKKKPIGHHVVEI